jgi:ABC-type glycerol-3-phosphate transport system permease component
MRRIGRGRQIATQLGLLLVGLFVLLPLLAMAYMAFDKSIIGFPTEFRLWPEEFTLEVFQRVWERSIQSLPFLGALRNSLIVAGGAALLAVAFGAGMAYAFARYRFPGRQTGLFALLVGALLPPVALMTPLYILLTGLGLRTSLLGLMIVYTAFSMPFCIWNMRAAFQAVPDELEEAAFLDGATAFAAFRQVTLPLALPAIAVAALLAFLLGYSEFVLGWLFVDRADNVTLAMAIAGALQSPGALSWSFLSALAILMSAPVVVIFLFLYRYLVRGLLVGAVEE